jgi:uncharacterized membrane protein YGL010W
MSKLDTLLIEYSDSHQHPTNKILHWIDIPLIYLSVMGLLWEVKLPAVLPFFDSMPLNAAMPISLLVFVYYLNLSFALGIGILVYTVVCLCFCYFWETHMPMALWAVSAAAFLIGWVAQFIGHRIEGKKPSFLKDLQFFLIGPAWMVADIYRRIGVRL